MTPEAKVKVQCKKILDAHGAYYFFPVAGAIGAKPGIPDIIACHLGTFLGIECKSGNRQPTGLQRAQLERIEQTGGVALVIRETNLSELEAALKSIEDKHI